MWILVVGGARVLSDPEGGAAVLTQLGCRVETHELWDSLADARWPTTPPAAILIEARDEVDAGKAALVRLQAVPSLKEVPTLLAVSVPALSRLDPGAGFDDFVLVPFVPAELYARVRWAEWRRSEFAGPERVKVGRLAVDLAAHEVSVDGRPVELTHQEFALLAFLCQHRGRVFTRDQLLTRVWGVDYYGGSRTVDIHVRRIRKKLGTSLPELLTVRGVGYKMKAP